MFFPYFVVNQNIIKENQNEFPKERMKYLIHQTLEARGCICESKCHYQEHIVILMNAKHGFRYVLLLESTLVVS